MNMVAKLALWCIVVGLLSAPAQAQDPSAAEGSDGKGLAAEKEPPPAPFSLYQSITRIGACLAAAGCVIGGGLTIGRIGRTCIEAMARQPEAAGTMFAPMIVTAAMIEGGMLFAIVVCLLVSRS